MKRIFALLILTLGFISQLVAQSDYEHAKDKNHYMDSLTHLLKSARNDSAKLRLLFTLGDAYFYRNADSAIKLEKAALTLSQKYGLERSQALAEGKLGYAYTLTGDFDHALSFGFKANTLSQRLGDLQLIHSSQFFLMLCYFAQEDFTEALKYVPPLKQMIRSGQTAGPFIPNYTVLGMMGSIYERTNQPDTALYYEFRSLAIYKEWSGIYLQIGLAYFKKRLLDSSLYYYRRGLPIAMRTGINIDIVGMDYELSRVFEAKGQLDSAFYYANKALKDKSATQYAHVILGATKQLAHLYELKGMRDSSFKYLKLSIALNEKIFGLEKTRRATSYAFNDEIRKQEIAAQEAKDEGKLKTYGLLTAIIVFLLVGTLQWRSNRHKQQTNYLLSEQKEEIETQRDSLEQAYIELKNTQNQLIQREKMASLGELTAGIAHEIQNPLNFVNNFSDLSAELVDEMQSELKTGDKEEAIAIADDIKQNLEKIRHHGKRAENIVKSMLEHSRTGTGRKQPTDLNTLAGEVLKLSYHELRAKDKSFSADLVTHFDPDLPKANVVQQAMGRVLLNLLNNAFYATQQKTKITEPTAYKPQVIVTTKAQNGNIVIRVRDNGIGIPDNVRDKIMQPFFTTKPTGEGTGLGLSLSYDIVVKEHMGSIDVETREGEFTEFTVTLPA